MTTSAPLCPRMPARAASYAQTHAYHSQSYQQQQPQRTQRGAPNGVGFPGQKLASDLVYQLGFSVTPLNNRPPTRREAVVLRGLQTSLTTHYDEEVHRGHLERIWELIFADESGAGPEFQRHSRAWCKFGFQQKDPAADVRGGGELSLDFMIYLLERHRPLVERIFRAHRRRTAERGQYANYPFACAAIGITRKLCEVFQIVQPHLGPTDEYEVAHKHFWPCVQSKQTFMELACCTFSLLDHKWDEGRCSYMDFNRIMGETIVALVDCLQRLPVGITPSAHSFSPPEEDDYMVLYSDETIDAGTIGVGVGAGVGAKRPALLSRYEEDGASEAETDGDTDESEPESGSEDEDEDEGAVATTRVADAAWAAFEASEAANDRFYRTEYEEEEEGEEEEESEVEQGLADSPLIDFSEFETADTHTPEPTPTSRPDVDFFGSFGVN